MEKSNVISYLFETKAVKFCEENKPFWYTSGKIGPYFINAQYVYGSEKEAEELLEFINKELYNKNELPKNVFDKVLNQYNNNKIYKDSINEMLQCIKDNINIEEIDYVSGGERRDWFFSNLIAYLLKKPHLTIYKDSNIYESNYDFSNTKKIDKLENKNVLHVADIITVASSYVNRWIPSIQKLGSNIKWSLSVIDRMQGGAELLKENGVKSLSIAKVDSSLFAKALDLGIIGNKQFEMLSKFIKNPDGIMREFLIAHPEFIENSLKSDEKTRSRAQMCINNNFYNI